MNEEKPQCKAITHYNRRCMTVAVIDGYCLLHYRQKFEQVNKKEILKK